MPSGAEAETTRSATVAGTQVAVRALIRHEDEGFRRDPVALTKVRVNRPSSVPLRPAWARTRRALTYVTFSALPLSAEALLLNEPPITR